jgi:predicted glutamine amidotransferase
MIRTHLDSLRALGDENPDGWGIGCFLAPDSQLLPVVFRGEPRAPLDPRYDIIIEKIIHCIQSSSIAHVRKHTSGLVSGIPNPHPFQRDALTRDFHMLFAHNGYIRVNTLLDLIASINPTYLDSNPPDYEPEYIDSDLYAIYMTEIIDAYPEHTIEECIHLAITKLDSALGTVSAVFNFVMSDGASLWGVRYLKGVSEGYTLYYYPNSSMSDFWIAATEVLDTCAGQWVAVPNSTFVILKPNQPPHLVNIFETTGMPYTFIYECIGAVYPNPCRGTMSIRFLIADAGSHNGDAHLSVYDIAGCLMREFDLIDETRNTQSSLTWDGTDRNGTRVPAGIYFCDLVVDQRHYSKKMVILP